MASADDATDAKAIEAAWGERMIEVRVRFFTNGIAAGKGQVRARHAWTSGVVRLERNEAHGIAGGEPIPFNSMLELPAVIERPLIRDKIKLHASDACGGTTSRAQGAGRLDAPTTRFARGSRHDRSVVLRTAACPAHAGRAIVSGMTQVCCDMCMRWRPRRSEDGV